MRRLYRIAASSRTTSRTRHARLIRRPALEARAQRELPDPAASRTVERTRVIELADGEAEEVDAHERADASYEIAVHAGDAQRAAPAPGGAGVGEHADLDRQRPVEVAAAEGAPQWRAQFGVEHRHPRSDQAVEHRTRAVRRRAALARLERSIVVAAHQFGIADEH